MKNLILTLISTSLIFGFVSPQELNQNSNSGGEFTIQEKHRNGGN
ncbi:hypothetical protein P4631_07320 [Halalkalibacterium halodurans]|nr:hypothetical protein [Halalkalibacterium halodurans]MED4172261.1 hypothetical protein [Halalkalibacterium halodurans]